MYQINNFKEINRLEKIAITKHAKERMRERGIKVDDIAQCIDTGEAYYPDPAQWESDLKTRKER